MTMRILWKWNQDDQWINGLNKRFTARFRFVFVSCCSNPFTHGARDTDVSIYNRDIGRKTNRRHKKSRCRRRCVIMGHSHRLTHIVYAYLLWPIVKLMEKKSSKISIASSPTVQFKLIPFRPHTMEVLRSPGMKWTSQRRRERKKQKKTSWKR